MSLLLNRSADQSLLFSPSLKIRILPLPPLFWLFNRVFSVFSVLNPPPSAPIPATSSFASPPRSALDNLVASAKDHYAKKDAKGISVYRWEAYNETWRGKVTRGKKSIDSVILPGGVGHELLKDVKEWVEKSRLLTCVRS